MEDVAERVRRIAAARLSIDVDGVTHEARFDDDLHATSLDMVELIMSLEDEFRIEISDSDAEKVRTVGDVTALIKSRARTPANAVAG